MIDYDELGKEVNTITERNNGVSGIVIFDTRGETAAKSSVPGADGSVELSGIESSLAALIDIKRAWSGENETSTVRETLKDFNFLLLGFGAGELIVTFIEDPEEPMTLVFVNLDPAKSGIARRTARDFTTKVKSLL